jgi:hypothetical protein
VPNTSVSISASAAAESHWVFVEVILVRVTNSRTCVNPRTFITRAKRVSTRDARALGMISRQNSL